MLRLFSPMNHTNTIFLTGAPDASSLDWTEEGLLNNFCSALQRYLDHTQPRPPPTPAPTQPVAKWRAIPLTNKTFYESPARSLGNNNNIKHDFLDYSFAIHQSHEIAPQEQSMLSDADGALTFITLSESSINSSEAEDATTTFMSTDLSAAAAEDSGHRQSAPYRSTGPIMSIKAIPTAAYLQRLQPQTMTVNLIVGVITIDPPRTVTIRKGGYDMEIIEIMVGDETQAGFTISSWHAASTDAPSKNADGLRKTLQSMRPRDVILIERVALSSFRGQVFGQSLNRKATNNTTAFTVLHRAHQSPADSVQQSTLSLAVENKRDRVKQWVANFVGPAIKKRRAPSESSPAARKEEGKHLAFSDDDLPEDSQK
jgi:hypothetical protein